MTAQKLWERDQRVIDANAAITVIIIDFSVESHLRVDSNENFQWFSFRNNGLRQIIVGFQIWPDIAMEPVDYYNLDTSAMLAFYWCPIMPQVFQLVHQKPVKFDRVVLFDRSGRQSRLWVSASCELRTSSILNSNCVLSVNIQSLVSKFWLSYVKGIIKKHF